MKITFNYLLTMLLLLSLAKMSLNKMRINNSCCGIVYHSYRLRYLIKQLKTRMLY